MSLLRRLQAVVVGGLLGWRHPKLLRDARRTGSLRDHRLLRREFS